MTIRIRTLPPSFWPCIAFLGLAAGPATAAGCNPGEYVCAGSGGSILVGLGFKLKADGSYTDLDGTTSGRGRLRGVVRPLRRRSS